MKWWVGLLRWAGLLLALAASAALAQGGPSTGNGGRISHGNLLPIPQYRTPGTGAQSYFVDASLGSDTNNCTASGASACATIQGALNKIPKLLRDSVTVNVAAGNYAGFIVSGFTSDVGVAPSTAGLLIDGALVTSTLATGSATGTATSGTGGTTTGTVFGTLVDSGATWTVNDLVGRFITTTTPTNTAFVIVSNTATSISVAGISTNAWNAPTGSTTYVIQDPSVIITSAATLPATPINASVANYVGVLMVNNNVNQRTGSIVMRNVRVAPTSGNGVEIGGPALYQFRQVQIRPAGATAFGIVTSDTQSAQGLNLIKVDTYLSASTNPALFWVGGLFSATGSLFRGQSGGTRYGIEVGASTAATVTAWGSLVASEVDGFNNSVFIANAPTGPNSAFSVSRFNCGSATGTVGLAIGNSTTGNNLGAPATAGTLSHLNIGTCETGVLAVGPGGTDIDSLTGSAGVAAISVNAGAIVTFKKSGVSITGGTTEISAEGGTLTGLFSDVTAGSCLASLPQTSRVCGR